MLQLISMDYLCVQWAAVKTYRLVTMAAPHLWELKYKRDVNRKSSDYPIISFVELSGVGSCCSNDASNNYQTVHVLPAGK